MNINKDKQNEYREFFQVSNDIWTGEVRDSTHIKLAL